MIKIRGHIPVLDGIRGLAILMVILHHATVWDPQSNLGEWLVKAIHMGGYGVDLFFLLSGFLITGILLDSKEQLHFFRNFYCRRALRIFPLYYCFLTAILFILPYFVPFLMESPYDFASLQQHWAWYYFYLSNFFVAQKESFSHGGLDITWALAIEKQFYLVWPLMIYFFDRLKILKWSIAIVISSLLIRCLMWWSGASPIQIYVVTFSRLDSIGLGSFLSVLLRMQPPTKQIIRAVTNPMLLLISFLILTGLFAGGFLDFHSAFLNTLGYLCFAVFFTQLLGVTLSDKDSGIFQTIFRQRFLITAGKYSYAMYLFHLPICAILRLLAPSIPWVRDLPTNTLGWQLFFYTAVIGCTLSASFVSWHLLEKHALKLKRFFYEELPAPAQSLSKH